MAQDLNEYKREMVSLHMPFQNEETEILADLKFIEIYNENENQILQRRKEFESNINIEETIAICRDLCRENEIEDDINQDEQARVEAEPNPFEHMYNNPNANKRQHCKKKRKFND